MHKAGGRNFLAKCARGGDSTFFGWGGRPPIPPILESPEWMSLSNESQNFTALPKTDQMGNLGLTNTGINSTLS